MSSDFARAEGPGARPPPATLSRKALSLAPPARIRPPLERASARRGPLYTAVDATTARNEEGALVELLDGHLRYVCADRSVTVPVEYVLLDAGELRVYESTLRAWDTPRGGEIIPSIERSGILAEIREGLRALGVPHRICA